MVLKTAAGTRSLDITELVQDVVEDEGRWSSLIWIDLEKDPLIPEMAADLGEEILDVHSVLFLEFFDLGQDAPLDRAGIDLLAFSSGCQG